MYEVIKELLSGEQIPPFYAVHYQMPYQKIDDIEGTIRRELEQKALLDRIAPGDRVAITAGSRQIGNLVRILKTVVELVRGRGAEPYIMAAMGSHGGATGEGQRSILTDYGITEQSVGCPVVSDMATSFVGRTENGLDVYIDSFAASCDKIIVVNRVKVHTDFHGPVESGLAKMIAIGLGKQHGAEICHKLGFPSMSENIRQIADVVLREKPVAFGLAIVEDAFHNTAELTAVPAERFAADEPAILERARALMPRIPYDKIDILIVDEIGKNFSGAGMDPNVTGRSPRLGVSAPFAERIVVLNISEQSHHAGTGIGNADAITRRAYENFSFDVTYANGITSNDPESIKIPAVMPGDEWAIRFAMNVLMGDRAGKIPRIVWIKNTTELSEFYVSSSLLDATERSDCLTVLDGPLTAEFDADGSLTGFRAV